ncbi:putative transposase, Tnp1/En/Spm-like protein [Tanacetum coccineum]|uniref:Transposase, Tnp1/En/Spm-like protein n=1 Tax=Tanacetum coccineum TaxID=301880 RepID=A0ABQ5E044_9ASTR
MKNPARVHSVVERKGNKDAEFPDERFLSVVDKLGKKRENDASIQKSNGLATLEKKMEARTDGKQMLHNKELPKDCYKVLIDTSLVDAACIPDVGNNGFKIVKDAVGDFFAWPKGQLVLKDYNIKEEANGTHIGIFRDFDILINGSTLDIHLYWEGKGTTAIPDQGVYGPLISAITVTPS